MHLIPSLPVRTLARSCFATLDRAVEHEWLVTNGLGGSAAGTVGLANTRRYHGLLIAARRPPVGRWLEADAPNGNPDLLLLATGSEVSLCVEAYEALKSEGVKTRVISMPSWELFEQQSPEYRDQVLPPEVSARIAVEQAGTFGWAHYLGSEGTVLGRHSFGASAPLKALQQHFGFTLEHLMVTARAKTTQR
jgi:transketolase